MPRIKTLTTYLEMRAPPTDRVRTCAPREDVSVRRHAAPEVDEYLHYYRSVGQGLYWVDRLRMPQDQLRLILQDPNTEVYVLTVAERAAGFAELDLRVSDQVELAYFGLFPEFIGRGLGRFFLDWIVDQAWSSQPSRLWVHTCDLDHPAALPNYRRAGFQIYDQKIIEQELGSNSHDAPQ